LSLTTKRPTRNPESSGLSKLRRNFRVQLLSKNFRLWEVMKKSYLGSGEEFYKH
jgi:hypothetical protein